MKQETGFSMIFKEDLTNLFIGCIIIAVQQIAL